MGWAIALHGGASDIPPSIPSHLKDTAHAALRHSLHVGTSALASSRSALDVAELVVRELENSPAFNAGRGSVLTTEGTIEMDACIMDGSTKNCGAVSGLSTVVNPISLARLVMEKTPHVYLAFQGAEDFAKEQGVLTADMNYFITKENEKRLLQAKAANSVELDHSKYATTNGFLSTTENGAERIRIGGTDNSVEHIAIGPIGETVGCVVVDSQGACAAATSTGGLVNKMVGRIGDTPIVGAGTYANKLCAVSATGQGEFIIRSTMARDVAALLEYKGVSLAEAVNEVVEKHVPKGTAGLVAVSSSGEIAMAFNTTGMFRACADESGYSKIAIWN